jgi:hypothetical protein
MKNWNDHLSAVATIKSFKDVETIDSDTKLAAMIETLTAPTEIVASGDVLQAQSVKLGTLSQISNNSNAAQRLKTEISKQIHVGDKVMEISWLKGETPFVTKCIVNETGIVWDNVLYGVYMGQPAIETTTTNRVNVNTEEKRHYWSQAVNWIWGDKRGQMDYTMRISHTNGLVTSTVIDANSSMNSGTAFHKSAIVFEQGTHGMAKIAMGLTTPTAVLSFDENGFVVNGAGTQVLNTLKTLYP